MKLNANTLKKCLYMRDRKCTNTFQNVFSREKLKRHRINILISNFWLVVHVYVLCYQELELSTLFPNSNQLKKPVDVLVPRYKHLYKSHIYLSFTLFCVKISACWQCPTQMRHSPFCMLPCLHFFGVA